MNKEDREPENKVRKDAQEIEVNIQEENKIKANALLRRLLNGNFTQNIELSFSYKATKNREEGKNRF